MECMEKTEKCIKSNPTNSMKYKIEKWNNRIVFVFYESGKDFEEFTKIIDTMIKPDSKSQYEVTSWTESFVFIKNNIEIYFENFYDESPPLFSFELLPLGNNIESDLKKLKHMVDELSQAL